MKNQSLKTTGAPLEFPGKLVASLLANGDDGTTGTTPDDDVVTSVSVYVAVPNRGLPTSAGVRLNLFAELSGTQQHVASVVCPVGTTGLVMTVTGHTVDSWQVYMQATNPNQDVKISLAGQACCGAPAVKVRPDLLPLAFLGEDGLDGLENHFPFVPWGTGQEGAAGAELVFTVTNPFVRSVTIPLDTAITRSGFPFGSIVADQITFAHLTFGSVDWVN